MPLLNRRVISAATLYLIAFANAQTCYYPDGKTTSKDLPCDSNASESSCCGADAFCLADGLCYNGGLVTRGSCTDKTWGSAACAGYCKTVDASSFVAITPCTSDDGSNEFVCGVNTTACQTGTNTFTLSDDASIVLRPNQIAQLVGTALASAAPSSTAGASGSSDGFTAGALAGVAVGVALPLLIALGIMFLLLRREQRRFSKPKLMYKLPDEVTREDFTFTPPPPLRTTDAFSRRSSNTSRATNVDSLGSRRGSTRTATTVSTHRPAAPPTFLERYEAMRTVANAQLNAKEQARVDVTPLSSRHELASPTQERHELSDKRMTDS